MQTFLPYPDFYESARVLDKVRLPNQRRECLSILTSIREKKGWFKHPATQMWIGYEAALRMYTNAIVLEFVRRGGRNKVELFPKVECKMPWWMGHDAFHASHRSNLLRKDSEWYGKFGWEEEDDLPYVWPGPQGTFRLGPTR